MTTLVFANNAASTLSGAITSTATTCVLASGTGALFPNPGAGQYFVMSFNDAATGQIYEIVWVTARSGDTLTIVRGQEDTSPLSWLAGDFARNQLTAGQMSSLYQTGAYQGQQTTGYFEAVSTTQVAFVPKGGSIVIIDGVVYSIPSGGFTSGLTNVYVGGVPSQNLASSTVYDVFLFNNSGTVTFDFYLTTSGTHMTDTSAGNVGVEVLSNGGSPVSSRSYVGKISTNATPNFQVQGVGVISWFRQTTITISAPNQEGSFTSGSSTPGEFGPTLRQPFLTFGTSSVRGVWLSGMSSSGGAIAELSVGLDGITLPGGLENLSSYNQSPNSAGIPSVVSGIISEGSHYLTPLKLTTTNTGTATFSNIAGYIELNG